MRNDFTTRDLRGQKCMIGGFSPSATVLQFSSQADTLTIAGCASDVCALTHRLQWQRNEMLTRLHAREARVWDGWLVALGAVDSAADGMFDETTNRACEHGLGGAVWRVRCYGIPLGLDRSHALHLGKGGRRDKFSIPINLRCILAAVFGAKFKGVNNIGKKNIFFIRLTRGGERERMNVILEDKLVLFLLSKVTKKMKRYISASFLARNVKALKLLIQFQLIRENYVTVWS